MTLRFATRSERYWGWRDNDSGGRSGWRSILLVALVVVFILTSGWRGAVARVTGERQGKEEKIKQTYEKR